jgi:hypothetical protein
VAISRDGLTSLRVPFTSSCSRQPSLSPYCFPILAEAGVILQSHVPSSSLLRYPSLSDDPKVVASSAQGPARYRGKINWQAELVQNCISYISTHSAEAEASRLSGPINRGTLQRSHRGDKLGQIVLLLLRTTGRSDWFITIVDVHHRLISSRPPQRSVYVHIL